MLSCHNQTYMGVRLLPMTDWRGIDSVVIVAKMTYRVSESGAVALPDEPPAVRLTEEPQVADPFKSVRYPTDWVDFKPGTDVLLAGTAQPPAGLPTSMFVRLAVVADGVTLDRTVKVSGPRVWQKKSNGIGPGPAAPLEPTKLCYEDAYGGYDASDPDDPLVDWRNPSGNGVARDPRSLVGKPAPRLEDPEAPLDSRDPKPAGFGPIRSHWLPRSAFAGTYDERWRRERAPLRPNDYDPRHQVCSPLWSSSPLRGDEPVEVIGLTPGGVWRFRLPRYEPLFWITVGGATRQLRGHLDTFFVDADVGAVELTWRARAKRPRRTRTKDAFRVSSRDAFPEALLIDHLRRPRDPELLG